MNTDPKTSVELKDMITQFEQRRNLLYQLLLDVEGLVPNKPDGAFYMFPDISAYFGKTYGQYEIKNSYDLCLYLLAEAHVALVSGDAFGNDNCIRFSYAVGDEVLKGALESIGAVLAELAAEPK